MRNGIKLLSAAITAGLLFSACSSSEEIIPNRVPTEWGVLDLISNGEVTNPLVVREGLEFDCGGAALRIAKGRSDRLIISHDGSNVIHPSGTIVYGETNTSTVESNQLYAVNGVTNQYLVYGDEMSISDVIDMFYTLLEEAMLASDFDEYTYMYAFGLNMQDLTDDIRVSFADMHHVLTPGNSTVIFLHFPDSETTDYAFDYYCDLFEGIPYDGGEWRVIAHYDNSNVVYFFGDCMLSIAGQSPEQCEAIAEQLGVPSPTLVGQCISMLGVD
ncbi:MAG: hypothetical protein MJ094_00990 [Saccharofermentans sp.]|nr:hypothetical protein [Saccharofermentans sp.]